MAGASGGGGGWTGPELSPARVAAAPLGRVGHGFAASHGIDA